MIVTNGLPDTATLQLRFPVAVALALVATLVAIRFALGAGFGVSLGTAGADGTVPTGWITYFEDNFAYLSHAQQASAGALTFVNAFAWEDQPAIYFNPLFLVLGWISALTGIGVSGALTIAGLLAAAFTVVTSYAITRACGIGEHGARWAALLMAFGSGLSVYGSLIDGSVGVDRTHQDLIGFSAFVVYPFQAITLAVLAATVLAVLRQAWWLAAPLILLSATMRPYECVLSVASYGLLAVLMRDRARLRMLTTLAVAAAPACLYAVWVGQQPAWRDYARVTLEQIEIPRLAWVIGYGAFLPAAVVGWMTHRERAGARWFVLWVMLALLLVAVLGIPQVKLVSGLQLPLAVLAGGGAATLQRRFGAVPVGLTAAVLFLPTTLNLTFRVYAAHRIDAELVECSARIRAGGVTRVLCATPDGQLLPGLAPCRVFVGHWSMTPDYWSRRERLVRAGIEVDPRRADITATAADFARLLADAEPRMIVLREGAPALEFARAAGFAAERVGDRYLLTAP